MLHGNDMLAPMVSGFQCYWAGDRVFSVQLPQLSNLLCWLDLTETKFLLTLNRVHILSLFLHCLLAGHAVGMVGKDCLFVVIVHFIFCH